MVNKYLKNATKILSKYVFSWLNQKSNFSALNTAEK